MLPSGPAVMAPGSLAVGIGNSVNVRLGPAPAISGAEPLEAPEPEPPAPTPLPAAPELDIVPLESPAPVVALIAVPLLTPEIEPLADREPLADGEPLASGFAPEPGPGAPLAPDAPSLVVGGAAGPPHANPESR